MHTQWSLRRLWVVPTGAPARDMPEVIAIIADTSARARSPPDAEAVAVGGQRDEGGQRAGRCGWKHGEPRGRPAEAQGPMLISGLSGRPPGYPRTELQLHVLKFDSQPAICSCALSAYYIFMSAPHMDGWMVHLYIPSWRWACICGTQMLWCWEMSGGGVSQDERPAAN